VSNAEISIKVTVNGREWTRASSFQGAGPTDTIFVTETENDGTTVVLFGDGVQGATVPTGTNNITATYRCDDGSCGSISKTIESDDQSFWVIVRDDVQAVGWGDLGRQRRRRWWWW
jgi:hypothetical protein